MILVLGTFVLACLYAPTPPPDALSGAISLSLLMRINGMMAYGAISFWMIEHKSALTEADPMFFFWLRGEA